MILPGFVRITDIYLNMVLADGESLTFGNDRVIIGSFTRNTSTSLDGEFTVGAAVTGMISVALNNSDGELSDYDFHGSSVTVTADGLTSEEEVIRETIGTYAVDSYSFDGNNIILTAYDNMRKFDVPCALSTTVFPITLEDLVSQACTVAGVTLANVSIPNGTYIISRQPIQWTAMTWHDVIAYCSQIACCYAKILPDGRLYFSWYDSTFFNAETVEEEDIGDYQDAHWIPANFDLTISTDDVIITGVTVTLSATDNIKYANVASDNLDDGLNDYTASTGTAGYAISIFGNPLIETEQDADSVVEYLGENLIGFQFRPLNTIIPETPSVEAGDVAVIADRSGGTYRCFLSNVGYAYRGTTSISCDAASPMQNLKARYTETQKTRTLAVRTYEKAIMAAEKAMNTVSSAFATTMGLYQHVQSDGQGGTIYVYGNKDTLEASDIRWRFSAGALMVSSDYGQTWNGALSSDGIAVLQEISVIKIDAEYVYGMLAELQNLMATKASIRELATVQATIANLSVEDIKAGIIHSSDYAVEDLPYIYPAQGLYPEEDLYPSNGEQVTHGFAIDFSTGQILGAFYGKQITDIVTRLNRIESSLTYPKAQVN